MTGDLLNAGTYVLAGGSKVQSRKQTHQQEVSHENRATSEYWALGRTSILFHGGLLLRL